MAVMVALFRFAAASFAALWQMCRRGAGRRSRPAERLSEPPQVAACEHVMASARGPRQRVWHPRRALPALSEDEVIAFGLTLEASSDVMGQLRAEGVSLGQ